ncbi:hypothetical protein ACFVKB_32255 [Rhodococcus sp. NPDC127530]|uniref:hypothetical protein n=1 Tax=unclassified Rhodococcus (in: high G+C Gram-positive bacteria) TaxID=192944 RepID=UPI00362D3165
MSSLSRRTPDLARKNTTTTTTTATATAPDAAQLDVAALMKAVTESPQARDALMRSLAALGQSTASNTSPDTDAGAVASAHQAAGRASTTGSDRTARGPGRCSGCRRGGSSTRGCRG